MEAAELAAYNNWLAEHMEELVAQYAARVVVIEKDQIIHVAESETEAYRWVRVTHVANRPKTSLWIQMPPVLCSGRRVASDE